MAKNFLKTYFTSMAIRKTVKQKKSSPILHSNIDNLRKLDNVKY